jgi:hypothetical protein
MRRRDMDVILGGALGVGYLGAGFGVPWGIVGMVLGAAAGWWAVRRTGQEGRGDE